MSIVKALEHSDAPYTTYKNPGFDELFDRAFASTDAEEVKRLIGEMQRFLHADTTAYLV